MEQESPEELFGGHGHQPLFVLVRIILPAEGDLAVGKVHDPVIGNGDAMRVAGQIVENMFRSAEWPLRIDHPVLAEQRSQEGMEGLLFGEHFHTSGERVVLRHRKALFSPAMNFPRNTLLKHLYGQEESVTRVYPALVIGRKATGWDHAMDMRMDLQILSPGVQNAEETDLCAQMFGIGCDLQQSRGAGAEQKVIDDFLVLQSQPCEFVRDGKDHMHVFNRQQFFIAIGEPLIAGIGLALRTMSRTAGVE